MKKAELSDLVDQGLDVINDVRTRVKDLGRLRASKHTQVYLKRNPTYEELRIVLSWTKRVQPYLDRTQEVWKLVPESMWEMYFSLGCDDLREVKMLRIAIKGFLKQISERPPELKIGIPPKKKGVEDDEAESDVAEEVSG